MEDSSDDDDDEEEEDFYFYDGGWHSSPRPITDLIEAKQSAQDSQVLTFGDEESAKDVVVVGVEHINQSLINPTGHRSATLVSEDQVNAVEVNKNDDPNKDQNHGNSEFGSVEKVQESVVVVEVEIRHGVDEEDAQKITPNADKIVAVSLLEHNDVKEQRKEAGDNQQGHNDDEDFDQRTTETQTTANVVIDTTNSPIDASNQAMVAVGSIELSVCKSNGAEHLGGFKHKIRCWTRKVGRKIRGWSAKIRRTLTLCCCIIHTNPQTIQLS